MNGRELYERWNAHYPLVHVEPTRVGGGVVRHHYIAIPWENVTEEQKMAWDGLATELAGREAMAHGR